MICEIDGCVLGGSLGCRKRVLSWWRRCCFGPGDGQACCCEIDGKILGGMPFLGILAQALFWDAVLGCCLRCYLGSMLV